MLKPPTLRFFRGLLHPVAVFVILQCLWVAVTVLWVIWFINQKEALAQVAETLGRKNIDTTYGMVFLTLGCILLGMMLFGTVVLFIFTQRQTSLINHQRNFVSSVTHELRSPLASLQLSFETMQKDNLPGKVNDQLKSMALADIDRLAKLVDRILISARLDRGILGFDATVEEIPLDNFLRDIIRQSSYLDRNLSQRVVLSCDSEIKLQAPLQPLSLIFGNLLENAIHYSPLNTPIGINATLENDKIHIYVKDNGYGLQKSDLRRIFRMFHRTSAATKKAIPGTGLGLYIVHSMTQLMKGKVWAESDGIGSGSTFHVVIPVEQKA